MMRVVSPDEPEGTEGRAVIGLRVRRMLPSSRELTLKTREIGTIVSILPSTGRRYAGPDVYVRWDGGITAKERSTALEIIPDE